MKREEAIERIKTRFDKWALDDGDMKAIQTLIPELVESEDERIRKRLILLIKALVNNKTEFGISGYFCDGQDKEYIAYLEKQKEQKPHYSPLCNTIKDKIREYIANHFITDTVVKTDVRSIVKAMEEGVRLGKEEQKSAQTVDEKEYIRTIKSLISDFIRDSGSGITDLEYYQNICDWLDGRHIEQKPAEWDEVDYDEEIADLCDGTMSLTSKDIARHFYGLGQRCYKPAEWSEDIIRKAVKEVGLTQHQIDWFKTNVFSPKQKWSEEDEIKLASLINYFEGDALDCSTEDMVRWLKSLPPQPKQEIYLAAKHDLAINFMNYLDENRPEGKMGLSNAECEDIDKAFKENDWAKIVQYIEKYQFHWKPSREQMEALRWAIDYLAGNGCASTMLTLLKFDLKKLM